MAAEERVLHFSKAGVVEHLLTAITLVPLIQCYDFLTA